MGSSARHVPEHWSLSQAQRQPRLRKGRCNVQGNQDAWQTNSVNTHEKKERVRVRLTSSDPEGWQASEAVYELALARAGRSHTATEVDPSVESGQVGSLVG